MVEIGCSSFIWINRFNNVFRNKKEGKKNDDFAVLLYLTQSYDKSSYTK